MSNIDPRRFVFVATYMSPGVASDGGGFVIIGGKVIKVPPRGLRQLQAAHKLLEASEAVASEELVQQMQRLALDLADDAIAEKGH